MRVAGIDIGSRTVKLAVMEGGAVVHAVDILAGDCTLDV